MAYQIGHINGPLNKAYLNKTSQKLSNEPHREKTGFLPRRKQRRRSASR